jgi:Lon-like protease
MSVKTVSARHRFLRGFVLPIGPIAVTLDLSWLVVLPAGVWAVVTYYVPILGSFLSGPQTWLVTVLIGLFVAGSLYGHVLAHTYAALAMGGSVPSHLSLFLFGDSAQAWPAGATPWRELVATLAGSGFNVLLAGLAYLGWNAQVNPVINLSLLFAMAFNAWLIVINLTPVFPLDGGRVTRAIVWGLAARPRVTTRLGVRLGVLIALALTGWAIFLVTQHTRYGWATGGVTVAFALLLLAGLRSQPAWDWNRPVPAESRPLGTFVAGVFLILLLGAAAGLILSNDGIEAPGFALSVEPMVQIAAPHMHSHAGTFILTSVVSQTPIIAGEWAMAQLDPAVHLVPPVTVVPDNTTPQSLARQGFQQLDESTSTAIVVGLSQAGYTARLVGKGAAVVSVLPGSPAQGRLLPGDVITGLKGQPVTSPDQLVSGIQGLGAQASAQLQVERSQHQLTVDVPVVADPATGHPRIGIEIQSAGSDVQLPFPVKIVPQKIVGGPSAGLMFTLTVYNGLMSKDLTGGRKIAGTGTINLDGTVGPIGGVEQKVAAAEGAGAAYFLSPPDNYAAALSVARRIQVIKVATVEQAIAFLQSLPPQ